MGGFCAPDLHRGKDAPRGRNCFPICMMQTTNRRGLIFRNAKWSRPSLLLERTALCPTGCEATPSGFVRCKTIQNLTELFSHPASWPLGRQWSGNRRLYKAAAGQVLLAPFTSSVIESKDDVASSYRIMGGFFNMLLAIAILCFSPPEKQKRTQTQGDD